MSKFYRTIESVFKDNGLEDEKLKKLVSDLFFQFENYLKGNNEFALKVKENIDRDERIKRSFR